MNASSGFLQPNVTMKKFDIKKKKKTYAKLVMSLAKNGWRSCGLSYSYSHLKSSKPDLSF
jgi:hypothetical protein